MYLTKGIILRMSALVLTVCAALALAETEVGGILDGDNRWVPQDGPYLVVSDILIEKNAHLTIAPGTRVIISGTKTPGIETPQFDRLDTTSISIKVEGSLTCLGKINNRITFIPADTSRQGLGWYGIIFNKVKGRFNEISYTDIRGAYFGVTAYQCSPLVRTSVIEKNNVGVNCLKMGNMLVFNCIVSGNFTSGIRMVDANPHIANSIITGNHGNGIWCDGTSKVTFEYNCLFANHDGNFLDCDPLFGRNSRVNKNKDSVDHAFNLYRDPVFAGSVADSIAFAQDVKIATDKSKVKKESILKAVNRTVMDSSFSRYRSQPRMPFELSRYSPCIDAGDPKRNFQDSNHTVNDIGIFGGPEFLDRGKE